MCRLTQKLLTNILSKVAVLKRDEVLTVMYFLRQYTQQSSNMYIYNHFNTYTGFECIHSSSGGLYII
jgi:hypothetical protein